MLQPCNVCNLQQYNNESVYLCDIVATGAMLQCRQTQPFSIVGKLQIGTVPNYNKITKHRKLTKSLNSETQIQSVSFTRLTKY